MEIIASISQLQQRVNAYKNNGVSIGFVPTMGYLHEGHLSLVEQARRETDIVIMSIFVNPLQFGPGEDFERYPRNKERDSDLADKAGVDILFYPQVDEMYPSPLSMKVIVEKGVDVLCGQSRPGHFDGVATVVLKLFQIVSPTKAFFGMKDAQQVAVIENMIRDFNLPVQLVRCPTLREDDGLAKSSRNVNLTPIERDEASALYESLLHAKKLILDGENSPKTIEQEIKARLTENTSGTVDYVQILSYPELTEITAVGQTTIVAVAVKFTQARLIDNIIIEGEGSI